MTIPRWRILIVALAFVAVAGCAAGSQRWTPEAPAGFAQGLWHGLIAPPAFVVGLFKDGVEIYERDNVGAWYDFGFLLGMMLVFGGGGHTAHPAAQRRRRRRDHGTVGE